MDRNQYAQLAREIVSRYAQEAAPEGVESETLLDDEGGHYSLFYLGWQGPKRIYGPVIHLDVRDGKIWIQFDGTEHGIAHDLLEANVPESDIVLAWQHPFKRQFTPFAVA